MNDTYKFVNLPLPYAFDAMEPYIDAKTMELHHNRHLQTYIDNLNAALKDQPRLQDLTLEQLIVEGNSLPAELRDPVKNNAGGVYNHRFYFNGLMNPHQERPVGRLALAVTQEYGGLDNLLAALTKAALSVFGSGYAWLTSGQDRKLRIVTTANQDTPLTQGLSPILNVDVWEHAYYLKHYNKRGDYLTDWSRVIDWGTANKNYLEQLLF